MSTQSAQSELQQLRSRIDDVDAQIIHLLAQRFAATREVGALKARAGIAAVDVAREEAQRTRYATLAAELGLRADLIQSIFQRVVSEVVSNHVALAANRDE